jgi:hypothetical protein
MPQMKQHQFHLQGRRSHPGEPLAVRNEGGGSLACWQRCSRSRALLEGASSAREKREFGVLSEVRSC